MSRKNRSKFIAFRLKNNQICKAVFVQYDDAQARQIATHQPPASHHRHGLDSRQPCTKAESLEPGKPRRSQSQHPAAPRHSTPSRGQQEPGESQPPEDERQSQHPAEAERTQGQQGSTSPTQPREPGTPAPMQSQRPAKHQSQPHRLHPGSRRSGEGERGRGEKREGAHRKSQHKSAAHHLHPMRPPPRRSTHAASRPSIPGQTASPGERPAPGNSIPLLWSMRNYP